ncbi:PQQ-binding-like beta-propeller repeat protein [Actinoplanes sp. NPDC051861]|uniref:outer membrane protein assembly factor BamB family protein n=1 Tax=Actinoplanes sp. NPDC051861 TaxID=3155170 RepID=UPI00341F6387
MPVDLDELFTAMRSDADAVPLGPAATARERGRQRNRNRAILAAAAAVLVLVTGVGTVMRYGQQEKTLPAGPVNRIRGLEPVGRPIVFGGEGSTWRTTVSYGDRIYGVSELRNGENRVVAVDAATGKLAWAAGPFHPFYDYGGPIMADGSLLVVDPHSAGTSLKFLKPANGAGGLSLGYDDSIRMVIGDGILVTHGTKTGLTSAYDLAKGTRLWRTSDGAGRTTTILGMQTGAYDRVEAYYGPPLTISDDGFVQIGKDGRVRVRDMGTGATRIELPAGAPGAQSPVAYDGQLIAGYRDEETGRYQIKITDLTGESGTPRLVYEPTVESGARTVLPCGTGRICVGRQEPSGVVAVDTARQAELWTASLPTQFTAVTQSRGGRVLVGDAGQTALHDQDGRALIAGPGDGRFVDDENVLWQEQAESGVVLSAVSATDGSRIRIGETPPRGGNCTWTDEYLACPVSPGEGASELRIWRFTRGR